VKRHVWLPFALLALLACLALAGQASADAGPLNAKHFFWGQGQAPSSGTVDSTSNDLIYHGGSAGSGAVGVLTKPIAYVVYWGTEWQQGFQTEDTDGKLYSSRTLQNYVNAYLSGIGGSGYANIQTQYCRGVLPGSTSCVGGSDYVTNPRQQFGGAWTDATPVPDDIITLGLAQNLVDDPLAMEAQRAAAHFGNYNPNAVYLILTPPRPVGTGQPVYCGYHTQTTSIDGIGNPFRIQYSFIPWQNTNWPVLGQGCGFHNVNATSNSFGNGVFDSWSIVIGHEYEEAVTDPDNFFSVQDGWNDAQTSENGDKCAWIDTQNITLGGHKFAVQPLWSNEAYDATGNGCVVSR
jgi:hypothetical protein